MARLGPRFWPPKIPQKMFMRVPFCVLPEEMKHMNFFWAAQNGGFGVGAQKFMLMKFMCFAVP